MIKKLYALLCAISLMTALPAFGMEATYPCDSCQEEKTELTRIAFTSKTKNCDHIICQKCYNEIDKSQNGPIDILASTCACCPYMQRVKNKQCWQMKKSFYIGVEYNTAVSAEFFKTEYPNRVLPSVIDATTQSSNPSIENSTQLHSDNPPMPGNPPITTAFTINNKIKWLGAAGIAVIACYGIYKWWKGEQAQEKNVDDEQDWEKEEQIA